MNYDYFVYSPTISYGSCPVFKHISELEGLQGFRSVYGVTKQEADAIVKAGTTAKFAGTVWSARLWVDIDDYHSAEVVKERLTRLEYDFVMYMSGGKGAHFGILRSSDPSHLLPLLDKQWVKATIPEADVSLYNHLHLFRLQGTIHEKTGNKKELVYEQRGKAIEMALWASARDNIKKELKPVSISTASSVFESKRVMANSVPTTIGNRHATLLRLCYALADLGTPPEVAHWWLSEVNKMCEEPKTGEELEKIVNSAYQL